MAKNKGLSSSSASATDRDFEGSSATGYKSGSARSGSASGSSAGTRDKVKNLGSTATQRVNSSPIVALGAGAALGAVLGAVLPRTEKEKQLLAPIGTKLADAGTGAIERARETGKQKFDELAGDSVRQFFGGSSGGDGDNKSGSNA